MRSIAYPKQITAVQSIGGKLYIFTEDTTYTLSRPPKNWWEFLLLAIRIRWDSVWRRLARF